MRTTTLCQSYSSNRTIRRRTGILASLICGCTLLFAVPCRALPLTEVYLGSPSTGYVDVTAYVFTDSYGLTWVEGYNGQGNFQIVIDSSGGGVYDPNGKQIGIVAVGSGA